MHKVSVTVNIDLVKKTYPSSHRVDDRLVYSKNYVTKNIKSNLIFYSNNSDVSRTPSSVKNRLD